MAKLRSDSNEEYAARKAKVRATQKRAAKADRRANIVRTAKDVGKEVATDAAVGVATGGVGPVVRAGSKAAIMAGKALFKARRLKKTAKAVSKAGKKTYEEVYNTASTYRKAGKGHMKKASKASADKWAKEAAKKAKQEVRDAASKKTAKAAMKKKRKGVLKERSRAKKRSKETGETPQEAMRAMRAKPKPIRKGISKRKMFAYDAMTGAAGSGAIRNIDRSKKKDDTVKHEKATMSIDRLTGIDRMKGGMAKYKPAKLTPLRRKKAKVLTAKERGAAAVSGLKKAPNRYSDAERRATLKKGRKRSQDKVNRGGAETTAFDKKEKRRIKPTREREEHMKASY